MVKYKMSSKLYISLPDPSLDMLKISKLVTNIYDLVSYINFM